MQWDVELHFSVCGRIVLHTLSLSPLFHSYMSLTVTLTHRTASGTILALSLSLSLSRTSYLLSHYTHHHFPHIIRPHSHDNHLTDITQVCYTHHNNVTSYTPTLSHPPAPLNYITPTITLLDHTLVCSTSSTLPTEEIKLLKRSNEQRSGHWATLHHHCYTHPRS